MVVPSFPPEATSLFLLFPPSSPPPSTSEAGKIGMVRDEARPNVYQATSPGNIPTLLLSPSCQMAHTLHTARFTNFHGPCCFIHVPTNWKIVHIVYDYFMYGLAHLPMSQRHVHIMTTWGCCNLYMC